MDSLALLFVFISGVLCATDPSYSSTDNVEACLASPTPTNVSRWQSDVDGMTITVEWLYGKYTCFNQETCYGIHDETAADTVVLQLVPIEIQQGVTLRFEPSQAMGRVFRMQPYRVNQEDFVSCDHSRGSRVVPAALSHAFTVDPVFLQPGHNYFIVETDVPEFKCEFGLRLDVLVKSHVCSKDKNSTMCSSRGHCHSRRKQEHFLCECCHGYAGDFCDDVDGCASSPCLNGASCVDVSNDPTGLEFTCSCAPGYNGTVCDHRVENMCDTQPCMNEAPCVGNRTHFNCMCPHGFKGNRCEEENKYCDSSPCKHGICVERPLTDSYQCYCIPGHGGHHCEIEYNECQSNPCLNGGVCVDKMNGFNCQCTNGYEGKDCSLKRDLCDPNPCRSGVKCVDFGDDIACTCPRGTKGKHCEIDIDECVSSPCQNGGTCNDGLAGYKCTCPHLTSGLHCEIQLKGFVEANSKKESHPFSNQNAVVESMGSLHVVIGTLGGAVLLVLMILAVLYCRMHESYRTVLVTLKQMSFRRSKRRVEPQFDFPMEAVSAPYLSPDALYEASSVDYMDSPLNVPLVNSLKPKKV